MMNIDIQFIVMSTREPPNHDSGSWTRHDNKKDAARLAKDVGGDVWKMIDKDGKITMKKLA